MVLWVIGHLTFKIILRFDLSLHFQKYVSKTIQLFNDNVTDANTGVDSLSSCVVAPVNGEIVTTWVAI